MRVYECKLVSNKYKDGENMIAKLISIIAGIVFIAFFAGFNLDNKCNVSLVFYTFKNVPVFFTILVSFAIGMICSLPFALIHRNTKTKKAKEPKEKKSAAKDNSKNNTAEKHSEPEAEQKAEPENSADRTGQN